MLFSDRKKIRSSREKGNGGVLQGRHIRAALVLVIIPVLASCATTSTKVVGSWKDDHYTKTISKVLVISLAEETPIRELAEHTLAAKLRSKGVNAVASSDLMPVNEKIERKTVRAAIAGKGFDTVLVTRLVSVNLNTGYVPPTPTVYNFDSSTPQSFSVTVSPGYTEHRPVASIEINLYATGSAHLIWSMTTRNSDYNTVKDVIDSYSSAVIRSLSKDGLI